MGNKIDRHSKEIAIAMLIGGAIGFSTSALGPKLVGKTAITVEVPEIIIDGIKNGETEPAELYRLFAKEVHPYVVAGGEKTKVEVKTNGQAKQIEHNPYEPTALLPR